MDNNSHPIGIWHRSLALDPAISGKFILVDSTAAARYIGLYFQH